MPAWAAVDKAIAEAPESAAVIVRDNADAAQAISRGLLASRTRSRREPPSGGRGSTTSNDIDEAIDKQFLECRADRNRTEVLPLPE